LYYFLLICMAGSKKTKDLSSLAIYGGIGIYLAIFLVVRALNEFAPEISQQSTMLFGTGCLGCSAVIVCGILVKFPGASSMALALKVVAGLVMFPIAFLVLIYFPYFIPFSN